MPARMHPSVVACLLLAAPALAHIKLSEPPNVSVTDAYGSPNKQEPCGGSGTPTGKRTEVEAGATITVRWSEPIPHPGHFRLSLTADPRTLVTPTAVVTRNDCISAPIESTPQLPTLVDGLLPHGNVAAGTVWETKVTLPDITCDRCVLQLMQFMSSHAPPCYYYQCAELRLVARDAGVSGTDAGRPDADAGVADGGGLDPGTPDSGVGAGADAGGAQADDAGLTGGVGPDTALGGCGCGPGAAAPLVGPLVVGGLLVLLAATRKERLPRGSLLVRASRRW